MLLAFWHLLEVGGWKDSLEEFGALVYDCWCLDFMPVHFFERLHRH